MSRKAQIGHHLHTVRSRALDNAPPSGQHEIAQSIHGNAVDWSAASIIEIVVQTIIVVIVVRAVVGNHRGFVENRRATCQVRRGAQLHPLVARVGDHVVAVTVDRCSLWCDKISSQSRAR